MAKRKHREREPLENNVGSNNASNAGNPFGIDPAQLMGMLGGNFDINSLLSSMNMDGLNLSNLAPLANMAGLNLGNLGNMGNFNQPNRNTMNNMRNNDGNINNINNDNINNKKINNIKNQTTNDSNLDMLISLRGFVHPSKISFIDRMIELYKSGAFKDI
ncbi:hypothetical protein [Clostridium weizhouense]|uniref:Uncharacterized protein n=1 Tax=Clostridium weizhouense TaxID=2859781 RepID=A0ABS7AKG6_9CLOT|nr:hypothetical protein [Clostridium weizhouense]MBW6409164.1 hypothetical protein [Clostridium weizhouense]